MEGFTENEEALGQGRKGEREIFYLDKAERYCQAKMCESREARRNYWAGGNLTKKGNRQYLRSRQAEARS